MFKLIAFLAVLAVAFAAPAPAPAPVGLYAAPVYQTYGALPVASSSQAFVRNYNTLGYAYGSYPSLSYSGGYPSYIL